MAPARRSAIGALIGIAHLSGRSLSPAAQNMMAALSAGEG
jgi:hypothetical protein